jgi:glycosyltransferase involved in cell wall biosynthesis
MRASSHKETTPAADVLLTVTAFGGGGTERYVEDLAIGLSEKSVRVVVSVDSGSLDRMRRLASAGVPVRVLGVESDRPADYRRLFGELVRQTRPRLIHANAWAHHAEIVDVAAEAGIPTVCTIHGTPRPPLVREWLGLNSVPFYLYRQRKLARRSGPAISISNLGLKNLSARLGRVPSVVVYNGVPLVDRPAALTRGESRPKVIWLGSLIHRKRPLLAIEAFGKVLQHHPGAQLIMAGDGPLLVEVTRAAQQLPDGSVEIRGFCSSVIEALREAHVYLQTSADEGLAYSVLDAMSVGLPVVATDSGATREAVLDETTGLVCPLDNGVFLAQSIMRLLESPATAENYGRAGLKRVTSVFGLDRMVSETIAAYASLCSVDVSRISTPQQINHTI